MKNLCTQEQIPSAGPGEISPVSFPYAYDLARQRAKFDSMDPGRTPAEPFGEVLREIAQLTFPEFTGSKISIAIADRVGPPHIGPHDEDQPSAFAYLNERCQSWLVDLTLIKAAGPNIVSRKSSQDKRQLSRHDHKEGFNANGS